MRLSHDIDEETFARKHTELRNRLASIKLQLDGVDRSHDETAELAAKVFELSKPFASNGFPPNSLSGHMRPHSSSANRDETDSPSPANPDALLAA